MRKKDKIFYIAFIIGIIILILVPKENIFLFAALLSAFLISVFVFIFFSDDIVNKKTWKAKEYEKILEESFTKVEDSMNIEQLSAEAGFLTEDYKIRNIVNVQKGIPWLEAFLMLVATIYYEKSNDKYKLTKKGFAYLELSKSVEGTLVVLHKNHEKILTEGLTEMNITNSTFNNKFNVYTDNIQLFNSVISDEFMKRFCDLCSITEYGSFVIKDNKIYIQLDEMNNRFKDEARTYGRYSGGRILSIPERKKRIKKMEDEFYKSKMLFIMETAEMLKDAIINL